MQKTLTSGGHKQTDEMVRGRSWGTENRGRIVLVKNPGKIKKVWVSFLSLAVFASVNMVGGLSEVAYAEENIGATEAKPVYMRNEKADFMITRITPGSSYFEWTYKKQNPNDGRNPVYVNAWYGDLTDYELYSLGEGDVPGKQLIYKGTVNDLTFNNLIEGGNIPVWASRMAEGAHLMQNQSHQIDYVVIYDNGDVEHVRVGYGRCVESSPYVDGWAYECLLEDAEDGRVRYQPYSAAGQRLEIPAEEDALLTAKDEIWRAVTGWPEEEVGGVIENSEAGETGGEAGKTGGETGETGGETGETGGEAGETGGDANSEISGDNTASVAEEILVPMYGDVNNETLNNNFDQRISDDSNMVDGDDVVVPNLSKETGQRANILQPILYILGSTAVIFGWWFLFFGRRKHNKKGEGEK